MKLFLKTGVCALLTSFVFGIQGSITLSDAEAAWKPRKPVEFVIMAGKGGGADRLARFIQGIIEKKKAPSNDRAFPQRNMVLLSSTPDRIRTCDLMLRRHKFYASIFSYLIR